MSDADNSSSTAPKLNAAASEFVPGSYASKPATTTSAPKTSIPSKGGRGGGGGRGSGNRNGNYQHGGGMMQNQQYYGNMYGMDPQSYQQYMWQMQQEASQQGYYFDPTTNTTYMVAPAGYMMAPHGNPDMMAGMQMMGVPPYGAMPGMEGGVPPHEGDVAAGNNTFVTETAPVESGEASAGSTTTGTEGTTAAPIPAPVPSTVSATGKYVPPRAALSEPVAESTADPVAVADATAKMSGLSIDTENDDNDAPVDIEQPAPGAVLRYEKNDILALYRSEGVVIPAELKDFFSAADYAIGSEDGKKYGRGPLGTLTALAEAGASFNGGSNTPGRGGKGSQGNLRHNQSNNNMERSASSSSFGGGNRRKGGNRDHSRDREPGEIVEGDEGYVAFEGGGEQTPRERNSKRNKIPAVYKSRFALDDNDPQAIIRKANGILNKLSVTNFDKLSDEFLALLQSDATNEGALKRAVETMVSKAQMEENFCFIYADLCRKCIDTWTALEPEEGGFSAAPGTEAGADNAAETTETNKELRPMGKIFKEVLLSCCQHEFEFDHISVLNEIRENAELNPDERTEKEILLKKRITGHMRFIGELYMKDLISASVMKNSCLEVLIPATQEEELVCLCKLFQTIGAKIEKYHMDKSRQKKYKGQNMEGVLPSYFEKIEDISKNHPSSRVRFMMKDLIEMRNNDWTARREEDKMVNLDKKGPEFVPVQSAYASGDARKTDGFAAPADDWSVVPSGGKKKSASGAPSPVPGAGMSRTNSSAQMSRNGSSNALSNATNGGNRGGARSSNAPFKKEKSGNQRGTSRERKESSRPTRGGNGVQRDASESPVPRDEAETPVQHDDEAAGAAATKASYSTDLADVQKHVRSAMKEYYVNGIIEEPSLTFQELKPSPEIMSDVVKDMISQAVETSSEKSCVALCELLDILRTLTIPGFTVPILSPADVKEALYKFLNSFDDVLIDAPKAGTLGAVIVANLVHKNTLAVELFSTLPEDNEFAFSPKFAEFVVQVLAALITVSGAERAEEQFRASKLDLVKIVMAPPKETPEDVLRALATKYGVAFLA